MRIDGQGAIVSGGASGLGAATARRLAAAGSRVTILDRNAEAGAALAAELGGAFTEVDVTDSGGVAAAVEAAYDAGAPPRICVCCAGIGPPAKVIDREGNPLPLADFARIVEINLFGTFNVLSQFAARAAKLEPLGEERAVVVNTASVAAYEGQIGQPAYAASNLGIVGMTLPIAREFARHAIRVMTIAPGLFLTPLLSSLPQEAQDSLGQQVPFPNRLGDPAEYARLVQAIIENPMLNGETIRLDGAIRMAPR